MALNLEHLFAVPSAWTTSTDVALARSVGRWAEEEVMARRGELAEGRAKLLPVAQRLLDEVGLRHLLTSEEPDAAPPSGTAVTTVVALEQVARADCGIALALASTFTIHLAARLHGAAAVSTLLDAPDRGPWGALLLAAYDRADAGFDDGAGPINARRQGDRWRLDGTASRAIIGGSDADLLAVLLTLDDDQPGILVIEGSAAGVLRGEPEHTTGLAFCRCAELRLRAVTVADAMVLCRGNAACQALVSWYRLGSAAVAVGAMLAAYEILSDWVDNRVIKGRGQVFKHNALVASVLGEIGVHVCTGRMQLYALAQLLEQGKGRPTSTTAPAHQAASIAVSRAVLASAQLVLDRGMELMGSAGYATEWNLERYWRDVRTLQCLQGSSVADHTTLAQHLFGSEIA